MGLFMLGALIGALIGAVIMGLCAAQEKRDEDA